MCFYLEKSNDKFKIADKDIICFKIVRKTNLKNTFKSIHHNFLYKTKTLYAGLSFLVIKNCSNNDIIENYSKKIEQGYHSYYHNPQMISFTNLITIKCKIPIGAMYFYNSETKEYVSNQIFVIGEVNE